MMQRDHMADELAAMDEGALRCFGTRCSSL
jgi:hypothetical protein